MSEPITPSTLLESFESARKQCGKSKTAFYGESGAGRSLPDNLKRGAFPSVEKVVAIADYMGVSVDSLLGRNQEESPGNELRIKITEKLRRLPDSQLDRLLGYLEALLSE